MTERQKTMMNRRNIASTWVSTRPSFLLHLLLVSVLLSTSCAVEESAESVLSLVPFATSPNTWTTSDAIVLSSDGVACVVDSGDYGVLCLNRTGEETMRFGRRGSGPGEFLLPAHVIRGPNETIGIVDWERNRLAVVGLDGTLASEATLPGIGFFPATSAFSQKLIGFTSGYTPGEGGGFAGLEQRYVEIAVESGETLWQRSFRSELIDDACPQSGFVRGLGNGVMSPTGVLAFFRCRGQIAFFPGREIDSVKVIQSPTYTEELPNERDVEDYVSVLESLPFRPDVSRGTETYRSRPKSYRRDATFDEDGRLWVLTNRDQHRFSYLDVFEETGSYLGTIRLRDRVVGFDVAKSTLVVLADREDAMAGREVDWYDVSAVRAWRR